MKWIFMLIVLLNAVYFVVQFSAQSETAVQPLVIDQPAESKAGALSSAVDSKIAAQEPVLHRQMMSKSLPPKPPGHPEVKAQAVQKSEPVFVAENKEPVSLRRSGIEPVSQTSALSAITSQVTEKAVCRLFGPILSQRNAQVVRSNLAMVDRIGGLFSIEPVQAQQRMPLDVQPPLSFWIKFVRSSDLLDLKMLQADYISPEQVSRLVLTLLLDSGEENLREKQCI